MHNISNETIRLGETLDGDEICFHPSDPRKLYILPRFAEESIETGPTLWNTLEWLCSSGVLTEVITARDFEPFTTKSTDKRST